MMIGALSRRQKVYLCGENSRAKKHTQAAWEKRERKERERREQCIEKEAQKKKWKNSLSPLSLLWSFSQKKKGKRGAFFLPSNCRKIVPQVHSQRAYFLSSFIVPRTHTHPTTPNTHTRRMTDSKRSNAAGEKYALRGIYGSEPYWPQEKLKICVTGAGGFIGET